MRKGTIAILAVLLLGVVMAAGCMGTGTRGINGHTQTPAVSTTIQPSQTFTSQSFESTASTTSGPTESETTSTAASTTPSVTTTTMTSTAPSSTVSTTSGITIVSVSKSTQLAPLVPLTLTPGRTYTLDEYVEYVTFHWIGSYIYTYTDTRDNKTVLLTIAMPGDWNTMTSRVDDADYVYTLMTTKYSHHTVTTIGQIFDLVDNYVVVYHVVSGKTTTCYEAMKNLPATNPETIVIPQPVNPKTVNGWTVWSTTRTTTHGDKTLTDAVTYSIKGNTLILYETMNFLKATNTIYAYTTMS